MELLSETSSILWEDAHHLEGVVHDGLQVTVLSDEGVSLGQDGTQHKRGVYESFSLRL